MAWPMSQDYNEAIQDASCFADPELAQAEVVTNALGLPVPCSGNFADVYAVHNGQRKWAVKCFTREIPGLAERYVQISSALQKVNLPFMVEFKFLQNGIRVRGQWYPILKMQWVEGFSLNTFVKNNLDKPQILQTLCQIWVKLAARLRETGMAHGDLQHGNIMLVPGSKAGALSVRLVDYDGMYVPALELLKTIEVGHSNYQHPQRQREGLYNLNIDPFPHLVIYTALRGLIVGGKQLWDKYDNGDNLLFKQADLLAPARSALFQELSQSSDKEVRQLTNVLLAAAQKPLEQTPLLEKLVAGPSTKVQAAPTAAPRPTAVTASAPVAGAPANAFAGVTDDNGPSSRVVRKKSGNGGIVIAAVAVLGLLIAGGGVAAFLVLNNLKKDDGSVALQKDTPPQVSKITAPPSRAGSSEMQVPPPPSSKAETRPTPPNPENPPPPPPPGNSFSVTSIADVTAAPGEVAKLEIVFERTGPAGAIVANVDGLPKAWRPTAPPEFIGKKMIIRVPVSPDAEEATRRATVVLHLGDETARGECNFTVKKKGEPVVSKGAKDIRTYEGANDGLTGLSVSPDGRTVLAGSADSIARLWEIDSGKLLRSFNHNKVIQHVGFSPDGKLALTGGQDGFVRFWDTKTGEETSRIEVGRPGLFTLGGSFSPDGRLVAVASVDTNIYIGDVAKGQVVQKLAGHKAGANGAAFLPDGKQVLSVGWDETARLWDVGGGKEIRSFPHTGKLFAVAVSNDGRLGLTGGNEVRLIDLSTGESKVLDGLKGGVISSVGFSRDGKRALAGNASSGICVWDVASGRRLIEPAGPDMGLRCAEFTPTADRVLTSHANRTVHLWDLGLPPSGSAPEVPPPVVAEGPKPAKEVRRYDGPTDAVVDLTLSPDGKTLLAGGSDGKLRFWDWESGQLTTTIDQTKDFGKSLIQHVHYSPDGKQVIALSAGDNVARLWSTTSGELVRRLEKLNNQDGVFSPDGELLCISTGTGPLRLLKAATGEALQTFSGHRGASTNVVFAPDGKTILSGGDRTARLWDVAVGKELFVFEQPRGVRSVAVSPDGRLGLAGCDDGTIRVLDLTTGQNRHSFTGHQAGSVIWCVRFSRDGSRAISACHDGTFRVWDVATGKELVMGPAQGKSVGGAIFTPNGTQAITCGWDGTVRLWDLGLSPVGPAPEVVVKTPTVKPPPPPPPSGKPEERTFTRRGGVAYAFAPDGSAVLSPDRGAILLWSTKDEHEMVKLQQPGGVWSSIVMSSDMTRAMSASNDNIIRIWDLTKGVELRSISAPNGKGIYLQKAGFCAEANRVAAFSNDDVVRIWDSKTGKEIHKIADVKVRLSALALSPDGSQLLIGAWDGKLRLYDVESGRLVRTLEGHAKGAINSLAFSPDGEKVLSGGGVDDNLAKLWEVKTGKLLQTLTGHTKPVTSVAFSKDASQALTGGMDHMVRLWDLETGKEAAAFEASRLTGIRAVAFTEDGTRALSGCDEGVVHIFDISGKKPATAPEK